jgi:hypothetical protein
VRPNAAAADERRVDAHTDARPAGAKPAQADDRIKVLVLPPLRAGVAKLADARDSKSRSLNGECRFDSDLRHQPSLIRKNTRELRLAGQPSLTRV